jgi:AcrR family transcriptional regulator
VNPVAGRLSSNAKHGGDETRTRIIDATLQTLRVEGIVGTTARAIARTGRFNQALIFYHFGSVTDLLVAAATHEGEHRAARYAERLDQVATLSELVAVARELHAEEINDEGQNILTQLVAGAASSEELRRGLMAAFAPWMRLVEDAVERVLAGTAYAGVVKSEDLAFAIAALFLGLELLDTLDPERDATPGLFQTFEALAVVIEAILRANAPPPLPPKPKKPAPKKR